MTSSRIHRWPRALFCAAITLAVHVWLLNVVGLGSGPRKAHLPERQGPGANAIASSGDPTMTLVFLDESGPAADELEPDDIASNGTVEIDSAITVISPNPLPAIDTNDVVNDEKADAPVEAGNPAERAKLFGIYAGQIDARIERAWRRPRSPISEAASGDTDEDFHCKVHMSQDARGNVTEVELIRCNGSVEWQQSLVRAIQTASPLPAPPAPEIFSNVITMSFDARAYRLGMSEQGYERTRNF